MAKGPGTKRSVGKVGVRVAPELDRFREELRAGLLKELRGFEVRIPVNVDTKSVTTAVKVVQQEVKKASQSTAFDIDLKPSERAFLRLYGVIRRLPATVKTTRDNMRSFAATAALTADVVLASTKNLLRQANLVARLRNAWRDLKTEAMGMGTTVEKVLAYRAFKSVLRGVMGVYDGIHKTTQGIRLLGRVGKQTFTALGSGAIKGLRSSLAGITSGLGKLAAAFIPTTRRGAIFFGIMAGGAPVLGLIAGLLAGLPSLVAAFAGPIAAIALGFDGIKEAASVLSDDVERLKASLSENFAQGMRPAFEQLQQLFPVLDRGLNRVADGVTALFQSFVGVVTSARGMEQIETILNNVGVFLEQLTPFVTNFTQAFLTMATAGSQQFGLLADVLNRFAASFNAMIERVTANGTFAQAIAGLAKVTDALLATFVKLFEAGLQAMGVIGGPLATLISSLGDALVAVAPALAIITNLFATVFTAALQALTPILNALMPLFSELAQTIAAILVPVIQILAPLLQVIANAVGTALAPAFQALRAALEPIMGALSQIAQALAPILAEVFRILAEVVAVLAPYLAQLGQIIAEVLVQAFIALAPLLELVVQFLADVLTALMPIMPSLMQLVQMIAEGLIYALNKLVPILIQIAQMVFPVVLDAIRLVVPVVQQLASAIGALIRPIVDIVAAIVEALLPAFQAIIDVVRPIFEGVIGVVQGAFDFIMGLVSFFAGLLTGNWEAAWNGLKRAFSGAWNGIVSAVKGAVEGLWNFVKGIPGGILNALGNLAGLLWDAGVNIIQGLLNGLKSVASKIWNWFKNLISDCIDSVLGWLGIGSPSKVFHQIGVWTGKGLVNGLKAQVSSVTSAATQMADALVNSFAGTEKVGQQWAESLADSTPTAVRAVEQMLAATGRTATAEWRGQLTTDEFDSLGEQIEAALSSWSVQIDATGMAKLVNKANRLNARRR